MRADSGLDIVSLWKATVSVVDKEAFSADAQLARLRTASPKCTLSLLTFLVADASRVQVDDGSLIRVATALELLDMGTSRHYQPRHEGPDLSPPDPSLDLVAGDYWSARSMQIASTLGRPWVNGLLAVVVTEAAVAEEELARGAELSKTEAREALTRRGAIYAIACELGASLDASGRLESDALEGWRQLGRLVGFLRHAASGRWDLDPAVTEAEHVASVRTRVLELARSCSSGPVTESLIAYCECSGEWSPELPQ